MMQRGGFPFGRDELSPVEWMGLGVVAEEREQARAEGYLNPSNYLLGW